MHFRFCFLLLMGSVILPSGDLSALDSPPRAEPEGRAAPGPQSLVAPGTDLLEEVEALLVHHLQRIDPAAHRPPPPGVGAGGGRERELLRWVDGTLHGWISRRARAAAERSAVPYSVPQPVVAALSRTSRILHRLAAASRGRQTGRNTLARELRPTVRELGRVVDKYTEPGNRSAAVAALLPQVAPANDDCANATPISDGTFTGGTVAATNDGSASCGASGSTPDVWFRYTAGADGWVRFDTLGSGFDTVLSLHSACLGTIGNELRCDDDFGVLQSKVELEMTTGQEVLVRVSGFAGATGSFTLNVQPAGTVSGTVTESGSGDAIANVQVGLFDETGTFLELITTAADGTYTFGGIVGGTYYALTSSALHLDELYDDILCHPFGCDVTNGTAISRVTGADTTGVDFALVLGGSISGTVTDDVSSAGLDAVTVQIYDASGLPREMVLTASDGTYSVGGLATGTFYARVLSPTHLDELYDDVPCAFGCSVETGTGIPVALGAETSGVDFALTLGGSITGTVTDAASASALGFEEIRVYDGSGLLRELEITASDGGYTAPDLPTGTYFVLASASSHVDELYDDISCPDGCDPTTGTGVGVTAGSTTADVDFALQPFGMITGFVTKAGTGAPLSGVRVTAYDSNARPVSTSITGGHGGYTVSLPGSDGLRVLAGPAAAHASRLYGGLPFGLDVLEGAPVAVALGTTTSGIDLELWPLGACELPAELELSSVQIGGRAEYGACGDIFAGPGFSITASGSAVLRAGGAVALGDGVSVLSGGELDAGSGSILPPPAGDVVYSEGFDDGFALGWDKSNGATDLWRLDRDCFTPPSGAATLAFSRSVPDCDFDLSGATAFGWARSPVIDLSSAGTSATLELVHGWQTEGGGTFDRIEIQVSSDGGSTWTTIWSTTEQTSSVFVPLSLDVLPFATSQFRLRFLFDSVDGVFNDFAGWYVDDVVVRVQ